MACLTPDCLMRAGLLVSHSHPTPLFPSPVKKTNTHCLRQYSGLKWGGRMVVRQGQAPTPTVLILQTKHRGSGCNSGLCVRRPFPAWPNPGCLFCLFLEAVALMDSAGDADSMGFLSGGSALSPPHPDRWAPSALPSPRRGKHQPSFCGSELVSPVVIQSVGEGRVCELWGEDIEPRAVQRFPCSHWPPSLLLTHF